MLNRDRRNRRSGFRKRVCLALIAVLIGGLLYGAGARPVYADDLTVMDWTGLTEAFATSASGTTIRLGDNITQSEGSLTVSEGRDLTIDLAGYTLSITSSAYGAPAVRVDAGRSLTIEDSSPERSGALIARSLTNSSAPGIGGRPRGSAGTITINGGTVTASSGNNAAGIGGGYETAAGTIIINGGTVTANGSDGAAGIGGGMKSDGGTITINGGTITANGGQGGAGIGGGIQSGSGTITINDGTVYANGNNGGTGIGVGYEGNGGTIVIEGGTITPSTGISVSISVIGTGQSGGSSSVYLTNHGTIILPANYRLIIPEGLVLHNSGTITGEGRVLGSGTLNNSGTITVPLDGPAVEGNVFTLRFHVNGGPGSFSPVTLYATTLQQAGMTLPQPVRQGYAFAGWYTQPEDGVEVTDTYVLGSDLDVYARWRDATPPTLTLSSTAADPLNGTFTVTATFSKPVTGFAVGDVAVLNGSVSNLMTSDNVTYTFTVSPTANGLVTVSIPTGAVTDAAGNGNEASAPLTRTYDGTAPTVTLSSTSGDLVNGAFTVRAVFSEAVVGLSVDDIAVTGGAAGSWNAQDAATYTFEVTPTEDGLVTVAIPAGAANDAAGNGNEASAPLTRTYDGTAPTVTLSSTAADPLNGSFTVTATFSKSVTGFAAGDVAVLNGTVSGLITADNVTYTFGVTPTSDGLVTVAIPAGAANDDAGNGNEASSPLTRTHDGTAPTVTLSSASVDPLNGAFIVTATFSEAVMGFTANDVTVLNGEAGSVEATDAARYAFEVTPTSDGLVTVSIPAGAANDDAGNGNEASSPLTRSYDGTAPILGIDSSGSSEPAQTVEPVITVTDDSELTVLRYAWTSTSSAPSAEDALWQTFTSGQALLLDEGDGDRYVHVYARDRAGNENAGSYGPFVLDNTEPVLELLGENPYELPAGQPYVEPSALATDNIDGMLDSEAILVSGEVDTALPGSYTVHYSVSDRAGNTATATRIVRVYDGDPPVITLLGDNPLVIAIDSSYEEPGATAYDGQDGDITEEIAVTGAVDTQTAGTYTRLYNVSDHAGNAAAEVSRTVHVIAPPVLDLTGPAELRLVQGGTFSDPGATATDAYYGSLSEQISVSGTVDTQIPGVYILRYTVENPIGQTAEAVRTVTVTQAPPPYNDGWFWYPEAEGQAKPGGPTDNEPENVMELVLNGRTVPVDAVKETTGDGRTLMRLHLTSEQVADLFAARGDRTAWAGSLAEVSVLSKTVQAPVMSTSPAEAVIAIDGIGDIVTLEMPAAAIHEVRRIWPSARLRLVVDGHGMLLPLEAVEQVSADAVVALTIGRVSTADRDAAARTAAGLGAETLLAHPVAYALTADGRPVPGWGETYRERTMTLPVPAGADQATAVWIDGQGELHFVPSIFGSDGLRVMMPTRQDGAYTVIRSARTFADMAGHWAHREVEQLANKQIVTGRGTGRFVPSDPVTRAEFAALLVRGLGLPEGAAGNLPFTDVGATGWYAGAIASASEAGLVHGYEDGTFRPQEQITREQMAVMIIRAIAYAGQVPGESLEVTTFDDKAEISEWAEEAVAQLSGTGIIQGLTATTFAPQADASRAQSVVMLKRLLQHLGFVNP